MSVIYEKRILALAERCRKLEQRIEAIEDALGGLEQGSWRTGYYPLFSDFAALVKQRHAKEKAPPTEVRRPEACYGCATGRCSQQHDDFLNHKYWD